MTMLRDLQASFLHDIYTGERTSEAFLDPTLCTPARLDIYYNNTLFGLTDILANAFPVVQKIVGENFFKTIARHYVKTYPQSAGNRHVFGDKLPIFLAHFEPAQSLVYLSDVAALEWVHFQAEIADDALPLNFEDLEKALSLNPMLSLTLHPSVQVIDQRFNGIDIWAEHQKIDVGMVQLVDDPHYILIWRGLDDIVRMEPVSNIFKSFIISCGNGESFADFMGNIERDQNLVQAFQQEFAKAVTGGVFVHHKGTNND